MKYYVIWITSEKHNMYQAKKFDTEPDAIKWCQWANKEFPDTKHEIVRAI